MTNRVDGRNAVFATADGLACNASYEMQTCRSKLGAMPGFPNNAAHQQLSACGPEIEKVTANKDSGTFSYSRNCDGGAVTDGLLILRAGQKVTVAIMVSCKTLADNVIPNYTPGIQGQATCVVDVKSDSRAPARRN